MPLTADGCTPLGGLQRHSVTTRSAATHSAPVITWMTGALLSCPCRPLTCVGVCDVLDLVVQIELVGMWTLGKLGDLAALELDPCAQQVRSEDIAGEQIILIGLELVKCLAQ